MQEPNIADGRLLREFQVAEGLAKIGGMDVLGGMDVIDGIDVIGGIDADFAQSFLIGEGEAKGFAGTFSPGSDVEYGGFDGFFTFAT